MKKCLLCGEGNQPDDTATCPNDGEATWADEIQRAFATTVNGPAEISIPFVEPVDATPEDADAPKRKGRK